MPARNAGTATPTCEIAGEQQPGQPAVPDRHERPGRQRDHDRDQRRRADEPQRDLQPVGELRADRRLRDVRPAGIAGEHAADPVEVLRDAAVGRARTPSRSAATASSVALTPSAIRAGSPGSAARNAEHEDGRDREAGQEHARPDEHPQQHEAALPAGDAS